MALIENIVNAMTLIATNVINNVNASGILEPVINDLVVPAANQLMGKRGRIGWTCASAARRTRKAFEEYRRGGGSLRNPKFWLRSDAAICTATSRVLQAYSGISALTACKAEWAYSAGMSLEAAAQGVEGKLDIPSIPF